VTYPLAGWVAHMGHTGFVHRPDHRSRAVVAPAVLIWRPEHEVYARFTAIPTRNEQQSTHEHDFVIDDEHPSWPKKESNFLKKTTNQERISR
jgi:hypothetical protein